MELDEVLEDESINIYKDYAKSETKKTLQD